MTCQKCGGKTRVVDCSVNHINHEMYRKRKCQNCNEMFYTVEFNVIADENFKKTWRKYYRKHGGKSND